VNTLEKTAPGLAPLFSPDDDEAILAGRGIAPTFSFERAGGGDDALREDVLLCRSGSR
jgi:hypothetical protein